MCEVRTCSSPAVPSEGAVVAHTRPSAPDEGAPDAARRLRRRRPRPPAAAGRAAGAAAAAAGPAVERRPPASRPRAVGTGGAVASVDLDATRVGTQVLREGGNAVDAAIATAAALGVTEPYSSGHRRRRLPRRLRRDDRPGHDDRRPRGGAGVVRRGRVHRRRRRPARLRHRRQLGPVGRACPARRRCGRGPRASSAPARSASCCAPAERAGPRGLRGRRDLRPADPRQRGALPALPGDRPGVPARRRGARGRRHLPQPRPRPRLPRARRRGRAGAVPGPDRGGPRPGGPLPADRRRRPRCCTGRSPARTCATTGRSRRRPSGPPTAGSRSWACPCPPPAGSPSARRSTCSRRSTPRPAGPCPTSTRVQYLHRFAEATATAFADRTRYVGDVPGVPVRELLSQDFAEERACQVFDPDRAAPRPIAARHARRRRTAAPRRGGSAQVVRDDHGTTHLTVVDAQGSVASYTLTIEQTGGSGITVPGLGLPAQQRAHRLRVRAADAGRAPPQPARPGQAAALVDGAHDRARGRPARARPRLARRRRRSSRPSPRSSPAISTATGACCRRSPRRASPRATALECRPSRRCSTAARRRAAGQGPGAVDVARARGGDRRRAAARRPARGGRGAAAPRRRRGDGGPSPR